MAALVLQSLPDNWVSAGQFPPECPAPGYFD